MHYLGVVLAGEYVTRSAHIRCQLIDFIKATIDRLASNIEFAEIANDKIVSLCLTKARKFQVDAAHPKSLAFQPLDQVTADEPARTAYQCLFHSCPLRDVIVFPS